MIERVVINDIKENSAEFKAVQELSLLRKEIKKDLQLIDRSVKDVLDANIRLKEQILNCDEVELQIKQLDFATTIDYTNDTLTYISNLINGLLS